MEKMNLKLAEFLSLAIELNGAGVPESEYKGILNEKMPLATRYWLNEISKQATAEKTVIDKFRDELVVKYGSQDAEGNYSLPTFIEEDGNRVINPEFVKFNEEFSTLLDQEKELSYKPLSLKDVEMIESSANCPVFLKLLIAE
mgnify:CR=1 FL=1